MDVLLRPHQCHYPFAYNYITCILIFGLVSLLFHPQVIDGSTRVAILVFDTPIAAKKVQKKLDQHTIHGQKLSLRPFHPAGDKGAATAGVSRGGEAGTPKSISDLSQMRGQAKRNNRLIIRNLSFKATKEDLKVSRLFLSSLPSPCSFGRMRH